jgi:hypothetical protein
MTQPRVFQTATPLPGGSVLVAGGGKSYYAAGTSTAEVFTPVLMSVKPTSGKVGAQVTVSGSGFYAHEGIQLFFNGETIPGHVKASVTGTFSTTIKVPQVGAGSYQIIARGRRSVGGASATFTVTG